MKLKRFVTIVAVMLLSVTAFSQNKSAFEVKFSIKGVTVPEVYSNIFGNEDGASSGKIPVSNGEFIVKGELSEPSVLRLFFYQDNLLKKVGGGYIPVKSSNLWLIVSPGSSFTVEGSLEGKDYIDIYPDNDKENAVLAKLNRKLIPLLNESVNLSLKLQKNQQLSAEQKKEIQDKIKEIDGSAEQVKLEFLNTSYSSVAALWLMEDMLIRSEIEPSKLAPIMAKVDRKKYGDSYFFKAVEKRINGALGTKVGNECPKVESSDTPDGKLFSLESLRGKYVIVDFWGTWCGPCLAGIPHMKAFRDKYAGKLEILGIAKDRDKEVWKQVINEYGMSWPHIFNGKGDQDFVALFNVQGYPTKILISPDGKILYRMTGESNEFYDEAEKIISNR